MFGTVQQDTRPFNGNVGLGLLPQMGMSDRNPVQAIPTDMPNDYQPLVGDPGSGFIPPPRVDPQVQIFGGGNSQPPQIDQSPVARATPVNTSGYPSPGTGAYPAPGYGNQPEWASNAGGPAGDWTQNATSSRPGFLSRFLGTLGHGLGALGNIFGQGGQPWQQNARSTGQNMQIFNAGRFGNNPAYGGLQGASVPFSATRGAQGLGMPNQVDSSIPAYSRLVMSDIMRRNQV